MSETESPSPGASLRAAYADQCIAIPGVFDALVAKIAERAGFRGLYLSGADVSTPGVAGALMGGALAAVATSPVAGARFVRRMMSP